MAFANTFIYSDRYYVSIEYQRYSTPLFVNDSFLYTNNGKLKKKWNK